MKVLLMSPLPPPAGGIATWTNLYLHSKEASQHQIDLVNTAVSGNRVKNHSDKNVFEEGKRLKNIFNKLKKFLSTNQYDVIHVNTACSKMGLIRDYLCVMYVKRYNPKIIIHFHCDTAYMVKDKMSTYFLKKLCIKADKIFSLNQSSSKHIKEVSNRKSIVIPNFYNENEFSYFKEIRTSEKVNTIIYVGHVVKEKGCIEIIKIAEKCSDVNFVLIGSISDEIKQMDIPENVKMKGEISKKDVLTHMLQADLFLFPTYTEGFPNVVLEAMVSGLPIITTPVGAIPEMIENQGGILVNVGDIEGNIEAIHLLENKEIREKMSKWNQEKVKKTYTTGLVMSKIFLEYLDNIKNENTIKQ